MALTSNPGRAMPLEDGPDFPESFQFCITGCSDKGGSDVWHFFYACSESSYMV